MNTLKPCPFCGGEDIEKLGFSPNCDTRPHIHCRDCGIDVYDVPTVIPIWHRNDSMVQAWNTRAEQAIQPAKLTADQVCECSKSVYFEGYSDGYVNRGAHLDETDWQAIADKLNAQAERGKQ